MNLLLLLSICDETLPSIYCSYLFLLFYHIYQFNACTTQQKITQNHFLFGYSFEKSMNENKFSSSITFFFLSMVICREFIKLMEETIHYLLTIKMIFVLSDLILGSIYNYCVLELCFFIHVLTNINLYSCVLSENKMKGWMKINEWIYWFLNRNKWACENKIMKMNRWTNEW